MIFRSTFELTADEAEIVRRAGKNPDDYIAMPIAVELDLGRSVDLLRIPAGKAGPARQVIRVPLMVGIDGTMLQYSTLVGANGQSARNPVDGMLPVMPTRMVLPQRNFTPAGVAAVAAQIETEKAAARARGIDPDKKRDPVRGPGRLHLPGQRHPADDDTEFYPNVSPGGFRGTVLEVVMEEGKYSVAIDPAAFAEPGAWGILLGDLLGHVCNAYAQLGADPATVRAAILDILEKELTAPTAEISGALAPVNGWPELPPRDGDAN